MDQDGKDSGHQEKSTEPTNASENAMGWRSFLGQDMEPVIGFVGWYVLNILMWMLFGAIPGDELGQTGILIILVFPIHILVLFVLIAIKSTRKFAYGAVVAIAVNFIISLVMGMITNAVCFVPFIFRG
jgi:hypothetical protein